MPLTHSVSAHVPTETLLKRKQLLEAYSVDHSDQPWRVCGRPVGPEDKPLLRARICFDVNEWHTFGRYTYQTRDEAVEKLATLGGSSLCQVSENEWTLYGMRYRVEKTGECQSEAS